MAGPREHALLDDPGIRANLEHVEVVIGFEDEAVGFAQMHFHVIGHITQVRANSDLGAVSPKRESHRIDSIVGNTKRIDFDIANGKGLAGLDGLDTIEPLAEGVRKNTPERVQGRLRDVKRGFP